MVNKYNYKEVTKREAFLKHFLVHGEQEVSDLLNFADDDCDDRTGCVCGTMKFFSQVCAIVTPRCNLSLPCAEPITPVGHCCPICGKSRRKTLVNTIPLSSIRVSFRLSGVYAQLTYDPQRFVMRKLFSVVLNKILNGSHDVLWHLSKLSDGMVHLILTNSDQQDDTDLHTFGEDLMQDVMKSGFICVAYEE